MTRVCPRSPAPAIKAGPGPRVWRPSWGQGHPYLVGGLRRHGGRRLGLEGVLGDEARVVGGHAGQPHGRLLGQAGAAVAGAGAGRVRAGAVGAAGPRVAAVDAVEAAAGGTGRTDGVGRTG